MLNKLIKRRFNKLAHRFMIYLTIAIVVIMSVNLIWNIQHQRQQAINDLTEKSQIMATQFEAMRAFIAQKQDVINYDSHGNFEFKQLNPAAVGKGVGDIFSNWTEYNIKQTKLEVRNQENKPDSTEREMIKKLQKDSSLKEVWQQDELEGKRYFRYMYPLYMEEWCLQCHGEPAGELDIAGYPKEGYGLGDFAGAISITIPMDSFYQKQRSNNINYIALMLIVVVSTILVTFLLMRTLVTNPLNQLSRMTKSMGRGNLDVDLSKFEGCGEIRSLAHDFDGMAIKLKEMYQVLEQRVEERTKQLKRSNQLQSEFLANMSHELRTPLTAIIAFTELMLERAEEKGDWVQAENLRDMQECGQRLLDMINDLLDMAKIEAGQMKVELISTDLTEVVNFSQKTLMPLAKVKNISLINNVSYKIPLVKADPERLLQIMLNLMGNALKFTPAGGTVTVNADVMGDQIVVSVLDTGIGLNKYNEEIVFDKFKQVESPGEVKQGGAGLGLALAKKLVELHGGEIWVNSEKDEGSAFRFSLFIYNHSGKDEELE
ncbi:signal transduction histidine kinase [Desulfitispora alkaliphila]|uniref:ATP-binding protein n=1 Tax=Desulfitispora alkaliphila TaxID=622674 RepID=UPI003D20E2E5